MPKRLRTFVESEGEIDKHAGECALLTKIRSAVRLHAVKCNAFRADEVKSGNLAVTLSKRFGNFDDFFIPDEKWQMMRLSFFEAAGLPHHPEDVPGYLTNRLNGAYDSFLSSLPNNTYAKVDSSGWQLSTDPAEKLEPQEEEKLDDLKSWLKKQMRSIKLPELLIEVDNELHFTHHFMTPAQKEIKEVSDAVRLQRFVATPSAICSVIAAIMAHGCNIGPYTMSRLTQAATYEEIKRITDWQLSFAVPCLRRPSAQKTNEAL